MDRKRNIGIVYSPTPEAQSFATRLSDQLALREPGWMRPSSDEEGLEACMGQTAVVISVGGDGTILRAARAAAPHRIPVLGINLGRLGFMTELRADEALDKVAWYLEGEAGWVEERAMLQAVVVSTSEEGITGRHTFHALNDVVVARGGLPRLVHIEAQVNGTPLTTYYADALIVATATGSTGYALAAGGPILHASSQDLVVMPVAPHVSLGAALVLSGDTVMTLAVKTQTPAMVSVDGLQDMAIGPGDVVEVQRSPYSARFLRARDPKHFYATLIQRLGLIPGARAIQPTVEQEDG